jgi:hypothetical protein
MSLRRRRIHACHMRRAVLSARWIFLPLFVEEEEEIVLPQVVAPYRAAECGPWKRRKGRRRRLGGRGLRPWRSCRRRRD